MVRTVNRRSGHRNEPGTINRVRWRGICVSWIHGIGGRICPVDGNPEIHGYAPVHAMGMTGYDGKDQNQAGKNGNRYKGSHIVLPDGCCRFPLSTASAVPKSMFRITSYNPFVLDLGGDCDKAVFRKRTSSGRFQGRQ